MRTQEQRIQEFRDKQKANKERLGALVSNLDEAQQNLAYRFYPSQDRFKTWALETKAKDPKRPIDIKEFLRDYCSQLIDSLSDNREEILFAMNAIKDWEHWFDGVEEEDETVLEKQMEELGIPLTSIQAI